MNTDNDKYIVKSGIYSAEVLDCYREINESDFSATNAYTLVLRVYDQDTGKFKQLFPHLYVSDSEKSEYMRLYRRVQYYFNTDYFSFEDLIGKTVDVDLTQRVSQNGKKYMKIRCIFPQESEE